MYLSSQAKMVDGLTQRSKELDATYSARAGRYDKEVVAWRSHGTKFEIWLAVISAIVGVSGAAGLFSVVSIFTKESDGGGWAIFWALMSLVPGLLSVAAAVLAGYLGVVQPRQKQANFGANSASCAVMATAARVVGEAKLEDQTDYQNAIGAIFTTLQGSIDLGLIPLGPEPGSKKVV